MTAFPNSPKLLRAGLVVMGTPRRVIPLQYNPDTLTRSLQPQGAGGEGGDRSDAMRLKGPPIETIKFEAELDATDALEADAKLERENGILPMLAALETLVYPASGQLDQISRLARQGVLEVAAIQAPQTLFVWGKSRVVPVRVTEFSITEEAFDENLNPVRAKVSLGLRVLSVLDLPPDDPGGERYMTYHRRKEQLAGMSRPGGLGDLGITESDLTGGR